MNEEHLIKTFRYRIYPTPAQEAAFRRIDGCCRLVFNWGHEARQNFYATAPRDADGAIIGDGMSCERQQKDLATLKASREFLKEAPAHCLQAALSDLDNAWGRYFKGEGERPTWRSKGDVERFRFKDKAQFNIRRLEELEPRQVPWLRALHDWRAERTRIERKNRGLRKRGRPLLDLPAAPARPKGHRTGMAWLQAPKFGMSGKDGGAIAMKMHRPIPRSGEILSCTIRREGSHWYASFPVAIMRGKRPGRRNAAAEALVASGEMQPIHPKGAKQKAIKADVERRKSEWAAKTPAEKQAHLDRRKLARTRIAGLDRNVGKPVVTSDGEVYGDSVLTPKLMARFARRQKQLARKLEALRAANGIAPGGSLKGVRWGANLRKLSARINKLHAKIARIRRDMIHKITAGIVRSHEIIVIEDLKLANMTASARGTEEEPGRNVKQKSGLNRALLDKGHGELARQLDYKCRFANRMDGYRKAVIRVNPAYTSQMCNACRHVQSGNREGEAFSCLACGHEAHADLNAARNIKERGVETLAAIWDVPLDELTPLITQTSRPADHRLLPSEGSTVRFPQDLGLCRGSQKEENTIGFHSPASPQPELQLLDQE